MCKYFGFAVVHHRGSHCKLEHKTQQGKVVTIVPIHRELSAGTLGGVLELAKIDEKDFWKHV